jgi:hypothetical protein
VALGDGSTNRHGICSRGRFSLCSCVLRASIVTSLHSLRRTYAFTSVARSGARGSLRIRVQFHREDLDLIRARVLAQPWLEGGDTEKPAHCTCPDTVDVDPHRTGRSCSYACDRVHRLNSPVDLLSEVVSAALCSRVHREIQKQSRNLCTRQLRCARTRRRLSNPLCAGSTANSALRTDLRA